MVQPKEIMLPGGHLAMSGDIFDGHDERREMLLASRDWKPGLLLNIPLGIGQLPIHQIIIQRKMSVLSRLRNPGLEIASCFNLYFFGYS